MLAASLVAFGHFLALFALTAALVVQLALVRDALGIETAKRIQRADRALGLSAILLLVLGFLRVVYFEKGADYYFSNTFFQIKLGLFVAAGLISIYPTREYFRWNNKLKQGITPELTTEMVKKLKRIIHWELILIGGILLCASLMAKGYGI